MRPRGATSAMWKNGTGGRSAKGAALQPRRRRRRGGWGNGEGISPPHATRGFGEAS